MDLLKILISVFFITFSLGEVAKIQFPNSISVGFFDLAVVLLSLFYLKKIFKGRFVLKIPILLFIAVSVFSLIINFLNYELNQILIGSLYLVRWIAYTGIYFTAINLNKKGKEYALKFMMISGVSVVILGYLQLIFYPNLKNLYYLGWDEHMHRMFSTFMDPNFAGVIFVLFFVFFFIFKDELLNRKSLQYFILGSTFTAIILTYSRGALVMLVISALIYSIIKRNWKIIVGTIAVLTIVFVILSPGFYIENTNLLRTASASQRLETSVQALSIFKKNPLGVGFNTYRYAREKYGFIDTSKFGPSHSGAGVDNSLVLILVTSGIPGFLAYTFLLYKTFKLGISRLSNNKMSVVLVVSLGGILVNSLFINSLLYSFSMAWIFLLAGLTESN
ncbi:MAG: hypothetical protein US51_C0013G0005 [Microgenomates group bacterium GW2011_GWA2_37_6]|nr:MAG: hypothetical protein US51_C0013G0005 [Microgenomates group bacterium GW2011_GWA2_37_6]